MMISKTAIILFSISLLPLLCFSQQGNPADLEQYKWQNRLLLIFAPTPDNVAYQAQLDKLKRNKEGLKERDVKVFHLLSAGGAFVDDRSIAKPQVDQLARKFGINPAAFTVILIDKDGTQKLRQTEPLGIKELFSVIDAMPMRQREMHDGG